MLGVAQVPWSVPKSAQIPLLAIVYFVAGKLGLMLAFVHASATAIWAPTGIALAAFILLGYRVWPAIFAGAFLVNITTPSGSFASNIESPAVVLTTLGIAVGNTLEGLTGAWLVNRFANGRNAFDSVRGVVRFAVLAGLGCTMVSATIGVLSLCLGGLAQWTNFGTIWLTWWMGDTGGALVVTPLIVLVARDSRVDLVDQGAEVIALFASAILITQSVFFDTFALRSPLTFLCVPPLIWAAFRFGPRETAAVLVLISGVAVWGTLLGCGPFVRPSDNESLLLLQAFMGFNSVLALSLAALVSERRNQRKEIQRARDELEQRVEQRTVELARALEKLTAEVMERRRAEQVIVESEQRFRAVTESANDAIISADSAGNIIGWNKGARAMFGYDAQEVLDRPLTMLMPERYRAGHQKGLERFRNTGEARVIGRTIELHGLRKNGGEFPIELSLSSWRVDGETFFSSIIRDITERSQAEDALRRARDELEVRVKERTAELAGANASLKLEIAERRQAEQQVRESLKEKEVLLKEIHHRVKNNLQVISSLLRLQAAEIQDPAMAALFYESQERVRAMALIHEQLYRARNLAQVDFASYLRRLTEHLGQSYRAEETLIQLRVEAADVSLPVDCAVPCGLIANELIANALKHAFPSGRRGSVLVRLDAQGGRTVMSVRDDGVGFPKETDFRSARSLGLQLVCSLADQLGGTLELKRDRGTEFVISFVADDGTSRVRQQ